MNRNMQNLSDALQELNWAQMVKVSGFLSDQVTHHWGNDMPVNRDSVAQILTYLAVSIAVEIEAEKAVTDTSA